MSVHLFPCRSDVATGDFAVDDVDDIDDVDDADESLNRFGSTDRRLRHAHLALNTTVIAAITGFPTDACEEFHHTLFTLLEAVGDFDGLIATPLVCIGRVDAAVRAQTWLAAHPAVDVAAMYTAACDPDADLPATAGDIWTQIDAAIQAHSLGLATAADTNPSLTFGSIEALSERLQVDICEITLECMPAQVTTMTTVALDLIARLPESVHLVGGASRTTSLTRDRYAGWQS